MPLMDGFVAFGWSGEKKRGFSPRSTGKFAVPVEIQHLQHDDLTRIGQQRIILVA